MHKIKSFKGVDLPVTDDWYAQNITAFPGIEAMDYAQLRGTIAGLHRKAEARVEAMRFGDMDPGPTLSDHELALIRACDAVLNINARAAALRGRDLYATYREKVGIDQMNLTNWRPDTCGCEHQYMWRLDHGGEGQPERTHYAHLGVKRCGVHGHLTDHGDHFAEVLAENQHKNATVTAVATALSLNTPTDVQWAYDGSRTLVVTHPALTPDKQAEVTAAIAAHPIASKRPVRFG